METGKMYDKYQRILHRLGILNVGLTYSGKYQIAHCFHKQQLDKIMKIGMGKFRMNTQSVKIQKQ